MLAPNPSQHLESENLACGNLEASVRSRDTGVGRRRDRDLIEAGLSGARGMAGSVMGIVSVAAGPRAATVGGG